MDDLIKRLRGFKLLATHSWAHEAADTIERLTARVVELEYHNKLYAAEMSGAIESGFYSAGELFDTYQKQSEQLDALRKQEPVAYVTDSGRSAVMVAGANLDDDTPLYTKALIAAAVPLK